jgi:hypothetical protein
MWSASCPRYFTPSLTEQQTQWALEPVWAFFREQINTLPLYGLEKFLGCPPHSTVAKTTKTSSRTAQLGGSRMSWGQTPTSWKTSWPKAIASHLSPIKKRTYLQQKKRRVINSHNISLISSSHSSSVNSSLNYQAVDIFKHVFQSSSCSQFLHCSFLRHFKGQLLNSYFFWLRQC